MNPSQVLAGLGSLVLERVEGGLWVRHGTPPRWCALLGRPELESEAPFVLEDVFPFLESFLPDAELGWRFESPDGARSDVFTQAGQRGEELHLEAVALPLPRCCVLVVTRDEQRFAQRELVLQRARELRFAHDELEREVRLKEILVHSIVHDLASPLHGVLGALTLLTQLPLEDEALEWATLALEAAERQKALLADMLEVFSAERGAITAPPDPAAAPDLAQAVGDVASQAQAVARVRQIELRVSGGEGPLRVMAEPTRLSRVLMNLVENALRHSPPGGRVTVSTQREDRTTRVNVDDDGPGVPRDVLPHLFELFAGGQRGVAGSGLGLYFCRITVERWNGGIGYERRPEGGSRFWIRLVNAPPLAVRE